LKRFVLPILLFCLVALALPAAASAMTYDEAVDQLVADGYTIEIEDTLNALGTDPLLGFRLAGTWAEHEASWFVRDELKAMGLTDVRLEAVPVDAWDFEGARVAVGERSGDAAIIASSFAGVPGTDGPLEGELVYVGAGTKYEFDAAGDVTGTWVLIDGEFDDWWVNFVGAEATLRGAAGVVMTYGEGTYPWYSYPDALGGNDGEYDDDWVPMVYVAWQDGDWLKEQLAAAAPGEPVMATVDSKVTITLAEDGGVGYNVVGVLEGSDPSLAPVLLSSHLDAHFRAGLDDTGAVANELLTAKAMKMAGVQPRRTTIFFFTCAEEYGYTDCWYDWAIGSWYTITETHADWAGEIAFAMFIELMAEDGGPLELEAPPDTLSFLEAVSDASADVLPYGYSSVPKPNTWTDQWSWSASGVPTVCTSAGGPEYDTYYHTTLENADRVNHEYVGGIAKWNYRVIQTLDDGVLPYDMSARGDQLIGEIQAGKLVRAGVSKKAATALTTAATEFRAAAWQWELRKAATPVDEVDAVNEELLALQEIIQSTFTSRDQWDFPAYPHVAAVGDALYLTKAINAAKVGNAARAQQMLSWWVGINWYMELFSPQVCRDDLERHYPDYEHVTWGAMGTPPLVVDCIDEYLMLGEGDFAGAVAGLEADRAAVQHDLRGRVSDMTAALKELTRRVNAL
jgi:hypothetical protein